MSHAVGMGRRSWRLVLWAVAVPFVGSAVLASAGEPLRVVMLGDSTTLNRRSPAGEKLTDIVQKLLTSEYGLEVTVINSGKGSDTVKGAHARLEKDVFAHDPDLVTISFGLNDSGKLTPDEFRVWLKKVVAVIGKETRADVLLVTSTPFDDTRHLVWQPRFKDQGGLDKYMDTNMCEAMRELARTDGLPICDLHARFIEELDRDPALMTTLIRGDGVHLLPAGNELAAKHLALAIRDALSPP